MTRDAPAKLASLMGPSWQASTNKNPVGAKSSRERYAVIRDTKRVSTVKGAAKGSALTERVLHPLDDSPNFQRYRHPLPDGPALTGRFHPPEFVFS